MRLGAAVDAASRKNLECPDCGADVDLSERGESSYLECTEEECGTEVRIS